MDNLVASINCFSSGRKLTKMKELSFVLAGLIMNSLLGTCFLPKLTLLKFFNFFMFFFLANAFYQIYKSHNSKFKSVLIKVFKLAGLYLISLFGVLILVIATCLHL